YLNACFQTKPFQQSLVRIGNGILAHRMRIPMELLKCELFPRPPLNEQHAINRYLDYIDRRIRRYIRARQKLIALLEEQKQVVIHQAVTGQIDVRTGRPYQAYKPSGVEWLGDVPEHWERFRLKTLLKSIDCRSTDGEQPLLSLRRDHGIVRYDEHFARPPQAASTIGYKIVEVGQIVVNRLQANNGLIFRAGIEGLVSPDYSVFAVRDYADAEFLARLVRTSLYKAHFRRVATGLGTGTAGFLRLYDDDLLDTVVYLPTVEHQLAIIEILDRSTASTNAAIARTEHEIALLREYRTRLIADVVTGKVDVRAAAAQLPDESEEIDAPEEMEEITEDEEGDEPQDHDDI
ncbi:MAG: restriction endonuclease subunit S, partial [Anaerolineae bacterium]|nr:restriction endonuclease subunit S [Anaerolineae bacterium]